MLNLKETNESLKNNSFIPKNGRLPNLSDVAFVPL
jgi:hypothetical protein